MSSAAGFVAVLRRCHQGGSRRSRRGAAGETLIESLVTVALVSLTFISSIYFVTTLLTVTRAREEMVVLANESMVAAEAIKSLTYVPCATPATYNSALSSEYVAPTNYSAEITVTGVEHLASSQIGTTTTSSVAVPSFVASLPSCAPAVTDKFDFGAQRISVRVVQTQTNRSTDLVFLKRDNRCTGLSGAVPGQRC